jgi:hypothetical protein
MNTYTYYNQYIKENIIVLTLINLNELKCLKDLKISKGSIDRSQELNYLDLIF